MICVYPEIETYTWVELLPPPQITAPHNNIFETSVFGETMKKKNTKTELSSQNNVDSYVFNP